MPRSYEAASKDSSSLYLRESISGQVGEAMVYEDEINKLNTWTFLTKSL